MTKSALQSVQNSQGDPEKPCPKNKNQEYL